MLLEFKQIEHFLKEFRSFHPPVVNPIEPFWPKLHQHLCSKAKFYHTLHQF